MLLSEVVEFATTCFGKHLDGETKGKKIVEKTLSSKKMRVKVAKTSERLKTRL